MSRTVDRLNRSTSRWSPRQLARRALVGCLPRSRFVESLPGTGAIYLTFDDGPHPEYTPAVLDVLREFGAKATFFVVGQECEKYPEIVRRIIAEGHAIGNHTYSHVSANDVAPAVWASDLRRANDVLRAIIGRETCLVRPPYGKLRLGGIVRLWQHNQNVILWNVDPKDFACESAEQLRAWFAGRPFEPGDVVLLHDVNPWTPAVLAELIHTAYIQDLNIAAVPEACN